MRKFEDVKIQVMEIQKLVRPNIKALAPYSSARDEFKGEAQAWLDANENSLGTVSGGEWNRYPDPYQLAVKEDLAKIKGVVPQQIFIGNGSDEAIDLLFRIFCQPGSDKVVSFTPTYGMYKVSAAINDAEMIEIPLTSEFQLPDFNSIKDKVEHCKLLFICSPNNPTANLIKAELIESYLLNFQGIVVLDEAYIDFASDASFASRLQEYPNLVILQTFSKAWGLAALRLGIALASPEIITYLNKVKPPYNINAYSQQKALEALQNVKALNETIAFLNGLREELNSQLSELALVKKIYPSDANFILIQVDDPNALYEYLTELGIVVRNRHSVVAGTLRITVGSDLENELLIDALKKYRP